MWFWFFVAYDRKIIASYMRVSIVKRADIAMTMRTQGIILWNDIRLPFRLSRSAYNGSRGYNGFLLIFSIQCKSA